MVKTRDIELGRANKKLQELNKRILDYENFSN